LKFLKSHIIRLAAAAILLCHHGGHDMQAQEISLPQRWQKALTSVRPIYRNDTLTIRIIGDVMIHSTQTRNAHRGGSDYDFSSYFSLMEGYVANADIAIANMEFPMAGEPYTGYPCFSAPDTLAAYMAGCGFDVFLAANNHIFDKGTKGTERTLEVYRRLESTYGIKFTGIAGDETELAATTPLFIRSKGISIALLNFTYGTNMGLAGKWPKTNYIGERQRLGKAFSKADECDADYIIALPHWGTEYRLKHSRKQEEDARWIAANGADFIVGSHPHVPQDHGDIEGIPVVYSLGNAVSNMSAENTQLGLMATIRIVRQGNGDLNPLPLEITYTWCSRPGGYGNAYTIIPVEDYLNRRELWKNPEDFDRMIETYNRIKQINE
jgi:poly-gamma-glutamate synthesis protein (capsule biosynthesis protein)